MKYIVKQIHEGTDWAIVRAEKGEDPDCVMTLEEARETASKHGPHFDFSGDDGEEETT